MWYRLVLTALCMTLSSAVFAHGTGQHVLGTVVAIDAKHVEVKTQKGTTVDVLINKQTRFKEKEHPKSNNLPTVGDRVVIEAIKEEKTLTLTATEVHFSSLKKQTPPAPALTQQAPATPAP